MYAEVTRDQFAFTGEAIIHQPTGAEFTPVLGHVDSVLIWTGEIGRKQPSGEVYRYAEVMKMMRKLWRERSACCTSVDQGAAANCKH
jgi:hypothetical protein